VMPDVVNQKMEDGNQFNIDQVNNLVDNDTNYSLASYYSTGSGAYGYPAAGFSMDAKIEGGESKVDSEIGDVSGTGLISSADAAIDQSAFNQNITQGANIQFNSISIQAAGTTLSDDDVS
jgi:hypothetical protein